MTIIQFKKLKKDFQKAEKTSNDTNFLAAREKNSLIRFIYEEPLIEGALRMPVYNFPSVFDPSRLAAATRFPFREAFDNLILKGNSFNNTESNWSNYEATINEAKELVKYYQYIESFLIKEKI